MARTLATRNTGKTGWGIAVAAISLALGCAGLASVSLPSGYRFFGVPSSDDPWSPKIAQWQAREQGVSGPASGSARPAVAAGENLRIKYRAFRAEQQRQMAAEMATWIQEQAKLHYVPDGALDHWATLEKTLIRNGDDCDGLELLVYHFLRDMGYGDDRVYRSIVFRPEDGQHHMVTLWFEDPEDPWVIDPTGAMTAGMPRLSQVPGWVPLKVFSVYEEYSARFGPPPARHASLQR